MNNLISVHPEARIGKNVQIGNFTTIHEDVEIGDNTVIYGNVTIFRSEERRVGKECRL